MINYGFIIAMAINWLVMLGILVTTGALTVRGFKTERRYKRKLQEMKQAGTYLDWEKKNRVWLRLEMLFRVGASILILTFLVIYLISWLILKVDIRDTFLFFLLGNGILILGGICHMVLQRRTLA